MGSVEEHSQVLNSPDEFFGIKFLYLSERDFRGERAFSDLLTAHSMKFEIAMSIHEEFGLTSKVGEYMDGYA